MAITGMGTQFQRSTDGGTTYNTIALIKSISGPSMTRETRDATTLDSTGGYREYIGTFRDGGEITLTLEWNPTGYADLLADYNSDSEVDYKIVLPDNTTFSFKGWVTGLPLTINEEAVTYEVNIKVVGPVTMS